MNHSSQRWGGGVGRLGQWRGVGEIWLVEEGVGRFGQKFCSSQIAVYHVAHIKHDFFSLFYGSVASFFSKSPNLFPSPIKKSNGLPKVVLIW